MEVGDISQTSLRTASTIDGIWLVIIVGIICLDSTGKLLALAISGWQAALGKKQ